MTVKTDDANEQVTMRVALMESLLKAEFNRGLRQGYDQGMAECSALDLDWSPETVSSVFILRAKSRRALSRMVAERNSRRSGDNPGMAYLWTCELLRAYRRNGEWCGVCVASTHYDV